MSGVGTSESVIMPMTTLALDELLSFHSIEVIEGVPPAELKRALEGLVVSSASRHGKYFWISFGSSSHSLFLHFGESYSPQLTLIDCLVNCHYV